MLAKLCEILALIQSQEFSRRHSDSRLESESDSAGDGSAKRPRLDEITEIVNVMTSDVKARVSHLGFIRFRPSFKSSKLRAIPESP